MNLIFLTSTLALLIGHYIRGVATLQSSAHQEIKASNIHPSASSRRRFIATSLIGASWVFLSPDESSAAIFSRQQRVSSYSYVLSPDRNVTDSLATSERTLAVDPQELSAEQCLLSLLPVKNPLFRELEEKLEQIPSSLGGDSDWKVSAKIVENCISELDKRRSTLEPVFNPEDNSLLQISKAERGEQLVEAFRTSLVNLLTVCNREDDGSYSKVIQLQRISLLALSEIGELLVAAYPYQVPSDGKFSYLPRLLGRARVTFLMSRNNKPLGNITIVADGFMAPITAGNFVDLSLRNFYTQLPVKFTKRRIGKGATDFDVANLPILGSYQEGFYDPLTAKLRRLPLELIRVERLSGVPNLAYAQEGDQPTSFSKETVLEPTINSKPLLSFRIPGLVAMNHPDKNPYGASSEFFALQKNSVTEEKRDYLDGEYAPFGFIVEGAEILEQLRPGDRIEDTVVDQWGQLNLVKIRQSSFSEVLGGGNSAEL